MNTATTTTGVTMNATVTTNVTAARIAAAAINTDRALKSGDREGYTRAVEIHNRLVLTRNLMAESADLLIPLIQADRAHKRALYGIEGDVEATAAALADINAQIDALAA